MLPLAVPKPCYLQRAAAAATHGAQQSALPSHHSQPGTEAITMNATDQPEWRPTREAALQRLQAFVPAAGRRYANNRNYDYGAGNHQHVSRLSPWLRHRRISEAEVLLQVLQNHSASAAEKFIQEVFWRNYWKGWLEMHPAVWHQYTRAVDQLYQNNSAIQNAANATSGNTGIDCFDHWCNELQRSGYLHNHARMWFASIWIFTLNLPWQLGADFFLRHLLDGDPASNTLSWRWVAGLHTRGKSYLARPDNIAKYTDNRFSPANALAQRAAPLPETAELRRLPLPDALASVPACSRAGLLVTDDDLDPTPLPGQKPFCSLALFSARRQYSPGELSPIVLHFTQALMKDTLAHSSATTTCFECCDESLDHSLNKLVDWAVDSKLDVIACAYTPVGANASALQILQQRLSAHNIRLALVRRAWDTTVWPHAGKGFFALKKKIPSLMQTLLPQATAQQTLF